MPRQTTSVSDNIAGDGCIDRQLLSILPVTCVLSSGLECSRRRPIQLNHLEHNSLRTALLVCYTCSWDQYRQGHQAHLHIFSLLFCATILPQILSNKDCRYPTQNCIHRLLDFFLAFVPIKFSFIIIFSTSVWEFKISRNSRQLL